jgi:hypothetical protein
MKRKMPGVDAPVPAIRVAGQAGAGGGAPSHVAHSVGRDWGEATATAHVPGNVLQRAVEEGSQRAVMYVPWSLSLAVVGTSVTPCEPESLAVAAVQHGHCHEPGGRDLDKPPCK